MPRWLKDLLGVFDGTPEPRPGGVAPEQREPLRETLASRRQSLQAEADEAWPAFHAQWVADVEAHNRNMREEWARLDYEPLDPVIVDRPSGPWLTLPGTSLDVFLIGLGDVEVVERGTGVERERSYYFRYKPKGSWLETDPRLDIYGHGDGYVSRLEDGPARFAPAVILVCHASGFVHRIEVPPGLADAVYTKIWKAIKGG